MQLAGNALHILRQIAQLLLDTRERGTRRVRTHQLLLDLADLNRVGGQPLRNIVVHLPRQPLAFLLLCGQQSAGQLPRFVAAGCQRLIGSEMSERVADHFGNESDALQNPRAPRLLVRAQAERE